MLVLVKARVGTLAVAIQQLPPRVHPAASELPEPMMPPYACRVVRTTYQHTLIVTQSFEIRVEHKISRLRFDLVAPLQPRTPMLSIAGDCTELSRVALHRCLRTAAVLHYFRGACSSHCESPAGLPVRCTADGMRTSPLHLCLHCQDREACKLVNSLDSCRLRYL